jgi:bifunctional enzyme CysN/CysC
MTQGSEQRRETMNVVIVGHVDHGKSTLVGRLLADTNTLGDGKLEKVQETCRRSGKTFEYAFLLDALEEEQGQGITIDAARVFFKTDRRDYIIIDAPGHIEFLKNMVTGAARAEAAILLIDAKEGVRENSRRHGYLLSMLGIKQVIVAINKIDLMDYDQEVFDGIVSEYRAFLDSVGINPLHFIPVSAREGDNIASTGERLSWFDGPTILQAVDGLSKAAADHELPLRMPVQDVYKFNERGDDRRIIAGRIESGSLRVGDPVLFLPSGKRSVVASFETFNAEAPEQLRAGQTASVTLEEQIYVSRGDIMCHPDTAPAVSTMLRANLFWLGQKSMEPGKRYKLKLATASVDVTVDSIERVLDASELDTSSDKEQVDRHDVAELVLRARRPIAFDPSSELEVTGRFVIVDGYDIAGGGIVREALPDELEQRRLERQLRDMAWVRGDITPAMRAELNGHNAAMVMFTGAADAGKPPIARALELALVQAGNHAYLLDGQNVFLGVDADIAFDDVDELVRRFGEVANILLDAGNIVISTTNVIGLADHRQIETQIDPFPMFLVHVGPEAEGLPTGADLRLDAFADPQDAVRQILAALGDNLQV